MLRYRALAYFAMLLAVFIWGVNFLVVKEGIAAWNGQKFTFLAARFWLATLIYAAVLGARHRSIARAYHLKLGSIAAAIVVGIVLAAGYAFQTGYLAQKGNGPVSAAFLTSTTVLWAPLLARLTGQRVYLSTLLGAAVAMTGIVFMEWKSLSWNSDLAHWFALFAAVAFAVELLLVSRFAPKDKSIQWTMCSCLTVAIIMTVLALLSENWPAGNIGNRVGAVIFTGIFATAVALGLQNWAQAQEINRTKIIDGPRAAIIATLEPVFTTLAVIALILTGKPGQEDLSGLVLLGCALILIGTLTSELTAAKRSVEHLEPIGEAVLAKE